MVDARHAELYSPAIGAAGNVVVHGHWGRPFLAFPAERGNAWEYGDRGVVGALSGLIDAGRAKLYCVDSFDGASWSNASIPLRKSSSPKLPLLQGARISRRPACKLVSVGLLTRPSRP